MTTLETMASFENLYQAHKNCRKGKQGEEAVIRFEMNLAYELTELRKQLLNYSYRLGGYHEFIIHDPKLRIIQALGYRDRVMQHSLCDNVLQPYLEPKLIYDNSACRQGKGTHFSMKRLNQFFRQHYKKYGTEGYILKYDIHKYFDSIDHRILFEQMTKVFPKDREIQGLLKMIIESYSKEKGRGLPMGNQSSQWFGIYYLNGLDHYIKENLKIKYYTRYMDDGIILHHDKEYLKSCLQEIKSNLEDKLHLELNQKTQIVPMAQGVDYLGFHFYLTDTGKVIRRLRTSSKKRMKKRLRSFEKAYKKDKITMQAVSRSLASYKGHLSHGHVHALWEDQMHQFVLLKDADRSLENKNQTKEASENETTKEKN